MLLPNTISRLPIPYANGLIVRGADYPRVFVVEKCGAYVVQVAEQREQALALLVVPHFDFVVVAARHKQRLLTVKRNASHWAYLINKSLKFNAYSVVFEEP